MSLSLSLNNALSGLNVNQQSLAVLSQNIANANTAGYSKQIVNQEAVSIAGQGEGVDMDTVTRKVDAYLSAAVQQQTTAVGGATSANNYNTQIQQLIGQPGSSNSIDTFIGTFFSDMQTLAQTPSSTSLQQTAVDAGATLANQVSSLANGLQGLQYQADKDIGTAVTSVNNDLKNIGKLNSQIVNQTALGQSVADLQDQRDTLVNDISQFMNIQTFSKSSGAVSITTGNGVPLLDESVYQLNYSGVASAGTFSSGATLAPITVTRLDQDGNPTGTPTTLSTSGTPGAITSSITGGQIAALMNVRDQQIPGLMSQLDTLTSSLRDQMNTLQNAGSGYPGTNSMTGERAVGAQDTSNWSGNVQIAVLDSSGQPIAAPYASGAKWVPPLSINLSTLNTGTGAGNPSVQGIINEINDYYGTPQNKANVGNLDNIQLASDSSTTTGNPPSLSFDFDLSNLSSTSSNFFVTGVSVKDASGNTLTPVNSTTPSVALNAASTYVTSAGSSTVTVNTTGTNTFTNGETVYLTAPAAAVDGIPGAQLGGYFTISNATANSFQITTSGGATASAGGSNAVAGQSLVLPTATVAAGTDTRTSSNGIITADLSGAAPATPYYTVTANVGVVDGNGNLTTSQITYQVSNTSDNMLNNRYGAQAVSGGGKLLQPTSTAPLAVAMLVDANGNELPKINGQYVNSQNGYLEIKAGSSTNTIAIGSLDSSQNGQPNDNPAQPGTGQGFSSYFNLNNFFEANNLTSTGDSVANSALNLQVVSSLQNNPSLISTGTLTRSETPASSTVPAYTFERDPGDNSVIQKIAALQNANISFAAAGGLAATSQTLGAYAGEVVAASASTAATAVTNQTNAQTLLTGFTQQASATSGVNLDDELANTVIYQNAYAASARVITVTNTLFQTLLGSFAQ